MPHRLQSQEFDHFILVSPRRKPKHRHRKVVYNLEREVLYQPGIEYYYDCEKTPKRYYKLKHKDKTSLQMKQYTSQHQYPDDIFLKSCYIPEKKRYRKAHRNFDNVLKTSDSGRNRRFEECKTPIKRKLLQRSPQITNQLTKTWNLPKIPSQQVYKENFQQHHTIKEEWFPRKVTYDQSNMKEISHDNEIIDNQLIDNASRVIEVIGVVGVAPKKMKRKQEENNYETINSRKSQQSGINESNYDRLGPMVDATVSTSNVDSNEEVMRQTEKRIFSKHTIKDVSSKIISDGDTLNRYDYKSDKNKTKELIEKDRNVQESEQSSTSYQSVSNEIYNDDTSLGIYCISLDVEEFPYNPDTEDEKVIIDRDDLFKALKGDESFANIISEIEREEILKKALDVSLMFDCSQIRNKKLKGVTKDDFFKRVLNININFKIPKKGQQKKVPQRKTVEDFKQIITEVCTKKDVSLLRSNRNDWIDTWEQRDQEEIDSFLRNLERRPTHSFVVENSQRSHIRHESSGSVVYLPLNKNRIENRQGETDIERWERVKKELFLSSDVTNTKHYPGESSVNTRYESTNQKVSKKPQEVSTDKKGELQKSKSKTNKRRRRNVDKEDHRTSVSFGDAAATAADDDDPKDLKNCNMHETMKRNSSLTTIKEEEDEELKRKYFETRRSNRRHSIEIRDETEGRLFGHTVFATPTYANFETGWHEEISLYKIEKLQGPIDERPIFISRCFDNTEERPSDAQVMSKQMEGVYDNGGAYVKLFCDNCHGWMSDSCSEHENDD